MHKPSFYLALDLPKSFTREDAEKIKQDLVDFLDGKRHYGAKYDGKNGITVKVISISTNND